MSSPGSPAASSSVVMPLAEQLAEVARTALREALVAEGHDAPADLDPVVRPSDRAHFQVNGALGLAKRFGLKPQPLGAAVAEALAKSELVANAEVSGPGFVNVDVTDAAMFSQVEHRIADVRLGVDRPLHEKVVIDYSQPNIAKEMHVGHIRSTIIGDALARVLTHLGADVVRHNHLGDWGTQFGMLIQYIDERSQGIPDSAEELNGLYRDSRAFFDSDDSFKDRARARVVELQAGEEKTLDTWKKIVAVSQRYFETVYDRLGVLLTPEDSIGESFYNPMLSSVVEDLLAAGIAERNEGAVVVFSEVDKTKDDTPLPLIIQKSDGGYGYGTTDLAAVRYRTQTLNASTILYVVDARQAQHFKLVFEVARRAGWLQHATAVHVAYGTVMRNDGKPFKTREGETARLVDLLDEAVNAASIALGERAEVLSPAEREHQINLVGVGALKFADLSVGRSKNYVFDPQAMVAVQGDTGVYVQYAHARICRVLAQAPDVVTTSAMSAAVSLEPAERQLALALDDFGAALNAVRNEYAPSVLAGYLTRLARSFTHFYENCPILKADTPQQRDARLRLCALTQRTIHEGLGLLGIEAPRSLGVAEIVPQPVAP